MSSENSIEDLRATLEQHAGEVTESVTTARVAAVKARAVRVRRRQAGVVVGAAAAVVAVVAAATVLPGGGAPSPAADRELLGMQAPAQLSALGYTYAFDEGVESRDGASSVSLDASDEPRLLTWAADSSVKLVDPSRDGQVSDDVAFDDWLVIPPGSSGTWIAHANQTALAVYTLTDDRPAGVTVDGITFREDVAGDQLIAAEIGELGQDEVSVDVVVPDSHQTRYATLCQAGPRNAWLHVDLGPGLGELVSGPACDDPAFDPGADGMSGMLGQPGETLSVSLYLTRGQAGARIDSDDVRLGLAAYDVAEPAATVAGHDVSALEEHAGHLWRYDGQQAAAAGSPRLDYENEDGVHQLVLAAFSRAGDQEVAVRWDGQDRLDSGVGNGVQPFELGSGQGSSITIDPPVPGSALLGYAIYTRAD